MPWLNEAEMAAWLAFLEVSHLLDRAIEQQLRQDAGISHAQFEVLSRLAAAPSGRLRMSELADVIVVSRSGLTYQVGQLEKAGLVRREKCEGDDRGVLAVLTAAGRAALARAAPGHVRLVRRSLIDALTPAQLAALTNGLAAARARLRAGAAPAGETGTAVPAGETSTAVPAGETSTAVPAGETSTAVPAGETSATAPAEETARIQDSVISR